MRGKALAEGVPKEQLSSRQLASALLELAEEEESPFVVFLKDKGSAVLKSRGMCQRWVGGKRERGGGGGGAERGGERSDRRVVRPSKEKRQASRVEREKGRERVRG